MCAYMMMALLKLLYHKLDILLVASGFFSELLLVSGKVLKAKRGGKGKMTKELFVLSSWVIQFSSASHLSQLLLLYQKSLSFQEKKTFLAFLSIQSASPQERKRPSSA